MDNLGQFFTVTGAEKYDVQTGNCGAWAVRWMRSRTGRELELPDVPDWTAAKSADVPVIFRQYAEKFGLARKSHAERGDVSLSAADDTFERHTGWAIGIYAGSGMWGFRGVRGLRFRHIEGEPEIWG